MDITIKDIAKRLGVSYSSVSRALNGKDGVSEETRKQIIETADQMGYRPNELARGLVNRVSNTVGVIIPDINNPYYGEIVSGITEAAREHGYNVFLCVSDYNETIEAEYFDTLCKQRVDGIILKSMTRANIEHYDKVNIPLMVIERYDGMVDQNIVEVDNVLGGYLAAKHLIDCGYRHPAFIKGRAEGTTSELRLAGARKALAEAGLPFRPDLVAQGEFTIKGGKLTTSKLFNMGEEIDCIFGMNDLIALGILEYCNENNIKVPEQLGVIGYDNISYAHLPQIQLTTIHQPKQELGRLMLETLLTEIQSKEEEASIPTRITLQPELVVRRTTVQNPPPIVRSKNMLL